MRHLVVRIIKYEQKKGYLFYTIYTILFPFLFVHCVNKDILVCLLFFPQYLITSACQGAETTTASRRTAKGPSRPSSTQTLPSRTGGLCQSSGLPPVGRSASHRAWPPSGARPLRSRACGAGRASTARSRSKHPSFLSRPPPCPRHYSARTRTNPATPRHHPHS